MLDSNDRSFISKAYGTKLAPKNAIANALTCLVLEHINVNQIMKYVWLKSEFKILNIAKWNPNVILTKSMTISWVMGKNFDIKGILHS